MDEQRLEEIVHGALERSWDEVAPSDIIADAIREALSSQEEALRSLREERDHERHEVEEAQPKRLPTIEEMAGCIDFGATTAELLADPVEAFVLRVNARAEADMLNGGPLAGAHCRAMQVEIAKYRGKDT